MRSLSKVWVMWRVTLTSVMGVWPVLAMVMVEEMPVVLLSGMDLGMSVEATVTEVPESSRLTSVDGSGQSVLDPEVQAKQAEEEAAQRDDGR